MASPNYDESVPGVASIMVYKDGLTRKIAIFHEGDSFVLGNGYLVSYTRCRDFLDITHFLSDGTLDFRKIIFLRDGLTVRRAVEVAGNCVILDGKHIVNILTENVVASEMAWKFNELQYVDVNTIRCGITGDAIREIESAEDYEGEIRWPDCNLRWFDYKITDTLTGDEIARCGRADADDIYVCHSNIYAPIHLDLSNFADKLNNNGRWVYITGQTGIVHKLVEMTID